MKKNVVQNIVMLYGLNIAKIIFPLLTLPYLTRILSVDTYAVVTYVKTVMVYMQMIVDFGFSLSGTKRIVEARNRGQDLNKVVSSIFFAQVILTIISFIVLIILSLFLGLLKENLLYTLISFMPVFLSIFLFEPYFRGIERMQVITIQFVIIKGIAAMCTLIFVKNDNDIMLIPTLDIVGSLVAVTFVITELKKSGISICKVKIKSAFNDLKESATYFLSNMATTAYGALNTVLIGAYLTPTEIAFWSVVNQMISAVQSLYSPVINGIYPEMVAHKNLGLIKRTLKIFMPIVVIGCIFTLIVSKYAILIVAGQKYVGAAWLLRMLVPVLLFSFPGMLVGWPTLGAINKAKQVTKTTVFTAAFQILGLIVLVLSNNFILVYVAILRNITEFVLLATRTFYCIRYKNEFITEKVE